VRRQGVAFGLEEHKLGMCAVGALLSRSHGRHPGRPGCRDAGGTFRRGGETILRRRGHRGRRRSVARAGLRRSPSWAVQQAAEEWTAPPPSKGPAGRRPATHPSSDHKSLVRHGVAVAKCRSRIHVAQLEAAVTCSPPRSSPRMTPSSCETTAAPRVAPSTSPSAEIRRPARRRFRGPARRRHPSPLVPLSAAGSEHAVARGPEDPLLAEPVPLSGDSGVRKGGALGEHAAERRSAHGLHRRHVRPPGNESGPRATTIGASVIRVPRLRLAMMASTSSSGLQPAPHARLRIDEYRARRPGPEDRVCPPPGQGRPPDPPPRPCLRRQPRQGPPSGGPPWAAPSRS